MFEKGDLIRWIYGRLFGKPMNFSFIDEHVAGSAGPLSRREVEWLREKRDVKAILSVREGPLLEDWIDGIEYLNVPMRNHFPPTLDQLRSCVDYLFLQISLHRKSDVHCAAGKGRTGTVLAAYLCRRYNLSADEAIAQIREKRSGSIERNQEAVIHDYHDLLKKEDVNEWRSGKRDAGKRNSF